jgi:peptidoglycan/xylan/chitin deacetylase (PgdA/CDA1 family)
LVKINAESLNRAAFQVRVLTTTQSHTVQATDESLLSGIPSEIVVDRVASPDALLAARSPKLGRFLAVNLGRHILPEIAFPWVFPALRRALAIVEEWKPDVIYSRATKHVSNVVGWHLKRRTGLPWVAHFSDPWITGGLPYRPIQRLIGRFFERRILRDADALVFVSANAAEKVLRNHPQETWSRVHIIPHGYSTPSPELAALRPPPTVGRPLQVIHAGSFYPGMRTPDSLIEALLLLKQNRLIDGCIEIKCIGVDTTPYQARVHAAGLDLVLKFEGSIPFDECQRRVATSDLTLIIDTPGYGGLFLPTKLFESFAFDHPVLGLTEPGSAVAGVLERVGMPWAHVSDPSDIASQLAAMLTRWEGAEWNITAHQRHAMDQFQIDTTNKTLVSLFDSLMPSDRSRFSPGPKEPKSSPNHPARKWVLSAARKFGLPALGRSINQSRPIVLMFHGLTDREHMGLENCQHKHLHVRRFESFLAHLKKHFRVIPLNELADCLASGTPPPPFSVALTLDDGYLSNYTLGFPLLKKFDAPATIFAATEFVDVKKPIWVDRVDYALNLAGRSKAELIRVKRELKSLPSDHLEDALLALENRLGFRLENANSSSVPAIYHAMDWTHAREMIDSGLVSIGAHTHSHKIMARCTPEIVADEVSKSKQLIEQHTGQPCTSFCYPNGSVEDFTDETEHIIRGFGFLSTITTIGGFNEPGCSPYLLKRLGIMNNQDLTQFDLLTSGMNRSQR